jgi:hypothetical protein
VVGIVSSPAVWFDDRTLGAPEALLGRVRECLAATESADLGDRLARAGDLALTEAVRRGAGRDAALDLLAADALITLALLERAEHDPAGLGKAARSLRALAAEAA